MNNVLKPVVLALSLASLDIYAVSAPTAPSSDDDGNFTVSWSTSESGLIIFEEYNSNQGTWVYPLGGYPVSASGTYNAVSYPQGQYKYRLRHVYWDPMGNTHNELSDEAIVTVGNPVPAPEPAPSPEPERQTVYIYTDILGSAVAESK
ncbi:hypothetical protein DS2_15109 [Catenovulum agarivorans DS-2]|uniref:Fibronectin type-III domain-containing protein n=1 Tax=Catenovulum agarivorans DS-2 TaxID=1328313 RepID=W7Q818_9ALTE|nr:hypothetical protein [Catenovulum agarivorans]EWH08949.1 hypothetical protein DS2_15109 [Catenovulum agarivorans DS-2]